MKKSNPIGVFDSGVGGLSVLKKLIGVLPSENYLYFGDTARVPYGEKSKDELIRFSREILNWFKSQNVKMVLIACNTSSATTLDVVKGEYDFPILGLISPTAEHIATIPDNTIGLMATSATVCSHAYQKAVNKLACDKKIIEIACPGLVEIVESNTINTNEAKKLLESYVEQLLHQNIEKLILGCTHYPYLADEILAIVKKENFLIDPADFIIQKAKQCLFDFDLLNNSKSKGNIDFFVSSSPEKFVMVGHHFFSECNNANQIDIDLLKV